MATARVQTEVLMKLNDLGLSLKRIGELTGYHWTTVKERLEEAGIPRTDTRRSFMDEIYGKLTPQQREWLSEEINLGQPIASFLRMLIIEKYNSRKRVK
jgi:beta-lactamase class A